MPRRWYDDENYYNGNRENDEYYTEKCDYCDEWTEHDVCTDECVECGC